MEKIQSHAKLVIVGGGILGVSLLVKDRSSGLKFKAKLPQLIRNVNRKGASS